MQNEEQEIETDQYKQSFLLKGEIFLYFYFYNPFLFSLFELRNDRRKN